MNSWLLPKLTMEKVELTGRLLRNNLSAFTVMLMRLLMDMEPLLSTRKTKRKSFPSEIGVMAGSSLIKTSVASYGAFGSKLGTNVAVTATSCSSGETAYWRIGSMAAAVWKKISIS